MNDQVLVKVEGASKKFCRSLKRSLWYGVKDVGYELLGRSGDKSGLRRDEFWAIDDISFKLGRGESLGLIGPNGAGKSTLLKMLNGLVKPDKGRITLRGRVGGLIELGAGFNPILTARENIYINASVLGFKRKEVDLKFDKIVDFAEIEDFIDTPIQSYSSGMKVRLGFAIASQMEPDILLIDEVLAVGDARFRSKCYNRLSKIKSEVATIFVSHSADQLARICDQGLLILKGKCQHQGDIYSALQAYESTQNIEVPSFQDLMRPITQFSSELEVHSTEETSSIRIFGWVTSLADIDQLKLRVSIFNAYGYIAADCELNVPLLRSGKNQFEVSLPIVSLKRGDYTISMNLIDSKGNFLVWSHREIKFSIESRFQNAISSNVLPNPNVKFNYEN